MKIAAVGSSYFSMFKSLIKRQKHIYDITIWNGYVRKMEYINNPRRAYEDNCKLL